MSKRKPGTKTTINCREHPLFEMRIRPGWVWELISKNGGQMAKKDIINHLIKLFPPEMWCRRWDYENYLKQHQVGNNNWLGNTPPTIRIYQAATKLATDRIRNARRYGWVTYGSVDPRAIVKLTKKALRKFS